MSISSEENSMNAELDEETGLPETQIISDNTLLMNNSFQEERKV